jgi:hypothetical protein
MWVRLTVAALPADIDPRHITAASEKLADPTSLSPCSMVAAETYTATLVTFHKSAPPLIFP